ncbi:hypothetical protein ACFLTA_08930 [Bacteroidota bacterium]
MYVYVHYSMIRFWIYIVILLLPCLSAYSQEIRLEHKTKPDNVKSIRMDKPVMVRTFDGNKLKGIVSTIDNDKIILEGKTIELEEIMTISGFLDTKSKQKAVGVGLTIGAGVILPAALYYILGGIAWGMPNGIFVGATVLVFDLFLAYAGTSLLGIYPRKFSTMNWTVQPPGTETITPLSIPLPIPSG